MKRLEVEHVTPSCAYVRGYGSRDLLKAVTGKSPVWATLRRAWVTQPHAVADLAALAESHGYTVDITGGASVITDAKPGVPVFECTDPAGGLW